MTHPLPSALSLFEEMADAVYLIDPATAQVRWTNRAGWQMRGLAPEAVLDLPMPGLSRYGMEWREVAAEIRSRTPHVVVGRLPHHDGHDLTVEVVTTVFTQDGQEHFLAVARDTARRLAAHDALTGLPNRQHGEEFLAAELELCRRLDIPLGLALLDLDHFKAIQDRHGPGKGDAVLQAAAGGLVGSLRRSDLVYGWRGDAFVIVCPNTGLEDMRQVAAKVRESLRGVDWSGALGIEPVTACQGLAVFPYHGRDVPSLLRSADAALRRAKAGARDAVEVASADDAV